MKPPVLASRYKRLRKDPPIDPTRLTECSDTELVSIAHALGHSTASRSMHRDDLLLLLTGEGQPPPHDELETIRRKTFKKVKGQSLLRTVLNCDTNCPLCPHDKVVACYATNHDLIDPIQLDPED